MYLNLIKFWYSNQYARVKHNGIYSDNFKICNGVRQGGILSGLLFCIYINALIDRISSLKVGCRLGLYAANIIAYADDLVLLAPSASALQIMMDVANEETKRLELTFNVHKCKIMIFQFGKRISVEKQFFIGNQPVCHTRSIKYLGFDITDNLSNEEDINSKRNKFYSEFNQILRKFHSVDASIKIFLFKQYCLQFYGAELWFGDVRSRNALKQFAVGYHKSVKKLINLSYHESNHYACEQAQLLIFDHYLNKLKMQFTYRLYLSPCLFLEKIMKYMYTSSILFEEVNKVFSDLYGIDDLFDNDKQAVLSRIIYVQNHESQMRGPVNELVSED